jgi:hypothetical protein
MSGLLTVQNMEGNKTLFETKDNGIIEWQRNGDPMGEDVQQVSEEVAKDRDFVKACARGVLRVLDDEDGAEASEAQKRVNDQIAKFQASRASSDAEISGRLDRPQDRSLSSYECIAPTGRNQTCGQSVMMRLNVAKETPPLCSRHQALKNSFVASDEGSAGSESEKPVTKWIHMGMA